jgi:hypothetical protein
MISHSKTSQISNQKCEYETGIDVFDIWNVHCFSFSFFQSDDLAGSVKEVKWCMMEIAPRVI